MGRNLVLDGGCSHFLYPLHLRCVLILVGNRFRPQRTAFGTAYVWIWRSLSRENRGCVFSLRRTWEPAELHIVAFSLRYGREAHRTPLSLKRLHITSCGDDTQFNGRGLYVNNLGYQLR